MIFDLDDTLFDHTTSASNAVRTWVPTLGATCTDDLLTRWFELERVNFDSWLAGRLTHQGQRA